MLKLLGSWHQVRVLEGGVTTDSGTGTPQGGSSLAPRSHRPAGTPDQAHHLAVGRPFGCQSHQDLVIDVNAFAITFADRMPSAENR